MARLLVGWFGPMNSTPKLRVRGDPPWRLWWILEEPPLQEMHVGLLVTATTPTTASVNMALLWTWPSLTVSNRKHLEMACLFYMEINTFSLTSKC